jgi:autotransporter adhesin
MNTFRSIIFSLLALSALSVQAQTYDPASRSATCGPAQDGTQNGRDFYPTASGIDSYACGTAAVASGVSSIAQGSGATATGISSTAIGEGANASGDLSIAAGNHASATGAQASAFGPGAKASGSASNAVGLQANASGNGASATGWASSASGDASTANGAFANASGPRATAIGQSSRASGSDATATGSNANASGKNSTANGANSSASGSNATALGAGSRATAANSVALGSGSVADQDNTVSVGSQGHERRITNVADGLVARGSTDAINGGQLFDAEQLWTDRWNTLDTRFNGLDRRISRICAMGAAQSQAAASAGGVNANHKILVGVGFCGGSSAINAGYQQTFKSRGGHPMAFTVGVSSTSRETSLGAGWSMGW